MIKSITRIFLIAFAVSFFSGCDFGGSLKKDKIIKIESKTEFDQALKCNNPVVAKFSAIWCTACKAMDPVFEKSADKYSEDVKFIDVDVDKTGDIAERFEIKGIPAFIYFKDGKRIKKLEGSMPQQDLDKSIESFK